MDTLKAAKLRADAGWPFWSPLAVAKAQMGARHLIMAHEAHPEIR